MTSTENGGEDVGSGTPIVGLYAELDDVIDRIQAAEATACTYDETVALAETHERNARRMSYLGLQRVLDCSDRNVAGKEGLRSITEFMVYHLRITDPGRRRKLMAALLSLHAVTGERLDPQYPHLAAAFADGKIGATHALTVLNILDKIPAAVDPDLTAAAEAEMADYACSHTPKELIDLGSRLLAHLDPDGTLTDDKDRARRRSLYLSKQDGQLMSQLQGQLDPTTRALLDVVLAAWAVAGMNNPGDPESPSGRWEDADPEARTAAVERDHRTPGQRNHDALHALLRAAVDGGLLGASHRGLPPHLIVTISETALRDRAGVGTTASGTLLPISEVIELAAHAQQHLAVFAHHSAEPLYLGKARLANQAQRLMLLARDGATCTCPDCDQPFLWTEAHHAEKDWADGGYTDIIDLAAACPTHNRMVGKKPGQWTTSIIKDGPDAGRPAWSRNTSHGPGPARVNRSHHIAERLAARLAARLAGHRTTGPTPQNRPPTAPTGSTRPPKPEERRRVPRLVAAGWTVTTIDLPPPT